MSAEKEDRLYEDLTDMEKIQTVLQDYLDDYNMTFSKETKLVFFQDAVEHVSRCELSNYQLLIYWRGIRTWWQVQVVQTLTKVTQNKEGAL